MFDHEAVGKDRSLGEAQLWLSKMPADLLVQGSLPLLLDGKYEGKLHVQFEWKPFNVTELQKQRRADWLGRAERDLLHLKQQANAANADGAVDSDEAMEKWKEWARLENDTKYLQAQLSAWNSEEPNNDLQQWLFKMRNDAAFGKDPLTAVQHSEDVADFQWAYGVYQSVIEEWASKPVDRQGRPVPVSLTLITGDTVGLVIPAGKHMRSVINEGCSLFFINPPRPVEGKEEARDTSIVRLTDISKPKQVPDWGEAEDSACASSSPPPSSRAAQKLKAKKEKAAQKAKKEAAKHATKSAQGEASTTSIDLSSSSAVGEAGAADTFGENAASFGSDSSDDGSEGAVAFPTVSEAAEGGVAGCRDRWPTVKIEVRCDEHKGLFAKHPHYPKAGESIAKATNAPSVIGSHAFDLNNFDHDTTEPELLTNVELVPTMAGAEIIDHHSALNMYVQTNQLQKTLGFIPWYTFGKARTKLKASDAAEGQRYSPSPSDAFDGPKEDGNDEGDGKITFTLGGEARAAPKMRPSSQHSPRSLGRNTSVTRKLDVGTLEVTILSASQLPAEHSNGTSDVYISVRLAGVKKKTPTKHGTVNPKWSQKNKFAFIVLQPHDAVLEVHAKHEPGVFRTAKRLGKHDLRFIDLQDELSEGACIERVVALNAGGKGHGEVVMELKYSEAEKPAEFLKVHRKEFKSRLRQDRHDGGGGGRSRSATPDRGSRMYDDYDTDDTLDRSAPFPFSPSSGTMSPAGSTASGISSTIF